MIDNNEPALDPYSIGKAYRIEGIGRYVEFVKNTFPKQLLCPVLMRNQQLMAQY